VAPPLLRRHFQFHKHRVQSIELQIQSTLFRACDFRYFTSEHHLLRAADLHTLNNVAVFGRTSQTALTQVLVVWPGPKV